MGNLLRLLTGSAGHSEDEFLDFESKSFFSFTFLFIPGILQGSTHRDLSDRRIICYGCQNIFSRNYILSCFCMLKRELKKSK